METHYQAQLRGPCQPVRLAGELLRLALEPWRRGSGGPMRYLRYPDWRNVLLAQLRLRTKQLINDKCKIQNGYGTNGKDRFAHM